MEIELHNFVFVWISIVAALIYYRHISNLVPAGPKKLLFFLPVILLFLLLPLATISLGGLTIFFIAWLCNFKLLLLAFGKGPLVSLRSLSLPLFVAAASLRFSSPPLSLLFSSDASGAYHLLASAQVLLVRSGLNSTDEFLRCLEVELSEL